MYTQANVTPEKAKCRPSRRTNLKNDHARARSLEADGGVRFAGLGHQHGAQTVLRAAKATTRI